jgi:predicted nucleic acid-binding OB-fold protein
MQERQITIRLHALCLGVGEKAARQILERNLQKRKICSRFVAHSLTVDRGGHRVECCSNLIDFAD